MQPKELNKYWKAAKEQAWELEETKRGFFFVPPDKTKPKVAAHKTPSARNWERQFLSTMKRSGFIWPWPQKRGRS